MSIPKRLRNHRNQRNGLLLIVSILLLVGTFVHITWVVAGLTMINLYTFILMAYDKRLAKRKEHFRIPERTFYFLGIVMGSLGIVIGMVLLHHKTKHWSFKVFYFVLLIQLYVVSTILQNY